MSQPRVEKQVEMGRIHLPERCEPHVRKIFKYAGVESLFRFARE